MGFSALIANQVARRFSQSTPVHEHARFGMEFLEGFDAGVSRIIGANQRQRRRRDSCDLGVGQFQTLAVGQHGAADDGRQRFWIIRRQDQSAIVPQFRGNQQPTVFNAVWIVDPQNIDCSTSDGGAAAKDRSIPDEVLVPTIASWIKERNQFAGGGIVARYIASFGRIAPRAAKTGVIIGRGPVMFSRANMIDLVRQHRIALKQLAVLTTVARTTPHKLSPETRHAIISRDV
jgi:hypothetical protein